MISPEQEAEIHHLGHLSTASDPREKGAGWMLSSPLTVPPFPFSSGLSKG